jgi:hypothetical protein
VLNFFRKTALLGAVFSFLAGCAASRLPLTRPAVESRMAQHDFVRVADTPVFALLRQRAAAPLLTVYIEGDGAAWQSAYRPPVDPTPTRPVVLEMVSADPAPAVGYLARPCQFLDAPALADCPVALWTGDRFSPEVMTRMAQALDQLKHASGAKQLRLIGYSGGGVIATLLAGRRKDVVSLATVAAPLRVAAWTAHHNVSRLTGDDPDALSLPLPPATHWIGADDAVVPAALIAAYVARTGGRLVVVPGYDHSCCWSADWPRFLKELP